MAIDQLAVADLSASETKKVSSKDLIQNGVKLIDDGTLPGAKLVANSVTAAQIGPDAITASELADGSVDTAAVVDLAITNSKIAAGVDGAKLTDDTVTAAKIPAASLNRGLDKTGGAIGHTNAVTPATRSGITFDAQGHITGTTALVGSDLPAATATALGGVSVPATSGLSVTAAGALQHSATLTAGNRNGITYNATGHITATAALVPGDLPIATATTAGAVSVPGPGLAVGGTGALIHADSGAAAGTYAKVTVDTRGHVTAGAPLTAGDIPGLDASKITSGSLAAARIGDGTITRQMLADYAITFIQEAAPPTSGVHAGALWLQESTGQLRMWNSNSWFPIGFGRLSQENLRYCGTFNAATGAITGVTPFGVTEGLKIGDQIPSASDKLSGVYLVATVAGNGTPAAAGVTFDNGDWVLCNGATAGWVRVDTLSGAGGGGGATHLNDLLDVTIDPAVAADNLLQYTASGQWINVGAIDGGTY